MNRREVIQSLAAIPVARTLGLSRERVSIPPPSDALTACSKRDEAACARPCNPGDERPTTALGLVIHSFAVRSARPLEPRFASITDPLAFLEHARELGAAGIQTKIGSRGAEYLDRLRDAAERHAMYLEGIVSLPKADTDVSRFESEVVAARTAGATVLRTVCLSGRRYEVFERADQFREFAEQSWQSLRLAEPVAARHKARLAVENHKDWRVDEMLGWLERLDSEYVGVTLDTGNSIALLEEPHAVVDAYAPWTMTTHFKDMAVAECDDGFLLSEVPLGDGFLDLRRIVDRLRRARPDIRFNLEMITRDPLRVPCLTEKYWATLGTVPGRDLADTLARVRRHAALNPLPRVSNLGQIDQLEREAANIRRSLTYARDKLARHGARQEMCDQTGSVAAAR